MTVESLSVKNGLKVFTLPSPDEEVTGGYCGDLLSWVMGRIEAGCAWITIMSNINILAVASLAGAPCVILAEGVVPDAELIKTAEAKGINLLGTDKPAFEAAIDLNTALSHE